MKKLRGMSNTDIAAEEGVTEAAVRNRLKKVQERFKILSEKIFLRGFDIPGSFAYRQREQAEQPSERRRRAMCLRHKVCISVSRPDGGKQNILKGSSCTMRARLLNFLFGEKVGVIILTPGESVENVEIKKIGGEA